MYDCAAGARYSRDQPFQQPGDLSDSPPRPIAEVGARCESPAGEADAMGSAEWLLRGAEEVLAAYNKKQDIFGGKHRAGCRKQRNELAAKVNNLMAKKRRAAANGDGGDGASKKRTTATTSGSCACAKPNATPKAATGGGGRHDGKAEFCTSLPPHPRASSFPLRAEGAKRGNAGPHYTASAYLPATTQS
eukprot:COSAG06_NODE_22832_length_711_cov_1.133987_1_plen_189_part_10